MRIIKRKRVPTNENLAGGDGDGEAGADTKTRKSMVESGTESQKQPYFMPPPPVPPEAQLEARLNDISNSSCTASKPTADKTHLSLSHSSYYSLTPASSTTSLQDLNQSLEDKRAKSSRRRSTTKASETVPGVKRKRGRPPKSANIQKNKIDQSVTKCHEEKTKEPVCTPFPKITWANANDLWQIMHRKDAQLNHDHLYLRKHLGIESQMRAILIDWLIEISYAYRLHRETLHLALEYMDRFLSECKQEMRVDRLQLIGMTALFLASKVEEIYPPKLKELASHMENYSNNNEEAIAQFELFMLKTLNWQISPVTSNTWLMTYLQIAAINYHNYLNGDVQVTDLSQEHNTHIVMPLNVYKNSSSNPAQQISTKQQDFYMKSYMKCITLIDLCLFDMDSMRFRYSMLAAAAMYHMLCKPASGVCADNGLVCDLVQLCSGYGVCELDPCIRWMTPYADVCKEVLGNDKLTTIKQFSSVDADDAHNIQLYYPNLDLLKEVQIRKTPSKSNCTNLANASILTPPESNRKNHQSGVV